MGDRRPGAGAGEVNRLAIAFVVGADALRERFAHREEKRRGEIGSFGGEALEIPRGNFQER